MTIRIKLVACNRYSYGMKGEIFEKGYEYDLEDDKAQTLLRSNNEKGLPFFARVERPAPAMEETVVEETTGEGVGGVRIIRRKGPLKANPKVKTSGDTASLEAEAKAQPLSDDVDDEEGVSV